MEEPIYLERIKKGWPKDIVKSLNRSLGQYRRRHGAVKVGITANPKRRFNEYCYREGIKQMVVIYKTSSINNANNLEKWFIENRWDILENQWEGYSPMTTKGPYYAYFVMWE